MAKKAKKAKKEWLFTVPIKLQILAGSYDEAVKTAMLYLQDIDPGKPESLDIITDWEVDNDGQRVIYLESPDGKA
jgi:hypothetical protein